MEIETQSDMKMVPSKRKWRVSSLLVLLVTLASCGDSPHENIDGIVASGYLSGDSYTNERLGFTCPVPAGLFSRDDTDFLVPSGENLREAAKYLREATLFAVADSAVNTVMRAVYFPIPKDEERQYPRRLYFDLQRALPESVKKMGFDPRISSLSSQVAGDSVAVLDITAERPPNNPVFVYRVYVFARDTYVVTLEVIAAVDEISGMTRMIEKGIVWASDVQRSAR